MKKPNKIKNFGKKLDTITDILYVPVMLVAIVVAIAIINIRQTYTVPNMFGYSVVRISSGSMENSGFFKNDTVMLKSVDVGTLKVGDIISFYYYNTKDKTNPKELPVYDDSTKHLRVNETDNANIIGLRSDMMTEAAKRKTRVYFHQIVDIRIAPDGTLWFKTWGTSNLKSNGSPSYDSMWTREDLVVGKYMDSVPFIRDALTFMSSSTGILVLVTLPCGILLIMLIFVFMEILDLLLIEKKIVKRKLLLTDKICVDKGVGYEMSKRNKKTVITYAGEGEKELYMSLMYRDEPAEKTKKRKKPN